MGDTPKYVVAQFIERLCLINQATTKTNASLPYCHCERSEAIPEERNPNRRLPRHFVPRNDKKRRCLTANKRGNQVSLITWTSTGRCCGEAISVKCSW